MYCGSCGFENDAHAVFCEHCGTRLSPAKSISHGRVCQHCGQRNPSQFGFCARCGNDLRIHFTEDHSRDERRRKERKGKSVLEYVLSAHPAAVMLFLLGGIFLFILGVHIWQKTRTVPDQAQVKEMKSEDPTVEASVLAIASRFVCSCGSCGEKSLDTCACDRAVEERQFIRNYLLGGQPADRVITALDQNYGGKKPNGGQPIGSLSGPLRIPKL